MYQTVVQGTTHSVLVHHLHLHDSEVSAVCLHPAVRIIYQRELEMVGLSSGLVACFRLFCHAVSGITDSLYLAWDEFHVLESVDK